MVVNLQGEDVAPVWLCLLRASLTIPVAVSGRVCQLLLARPAVVLQGAGRVVHALLLDHCDVGHYLRQTDLLGVTGYEGISLPTIKARSQKSLSRVVVIMIMGNNQEGLAPTTKGVWELGNVLILGITCGRVLDTCVRSCHILSTPLDKSSEGK